MFITIKQLFTKDTMYLIDRKSIIIGHHFELNQKNNIHI